MMDQSVAQVALLPVYQFVFCSGAAAPAHNSKNDGTGNNGLIKNVEHCVADIKRLEKIKPAHRLPGICWSWTTPHHSSWCRVDQVASFSSWSLPPFLLFWPVYLLFCWKILIIDATVQRCKFGCTLKSASLKESPWFTTWSITVALISSETTALGLPLLPPLPLLATLLSQPQPMLFDPYFQRKINQKPLLLYGF